MSCAATAVHTFYENVWTRTAAIVFILYGHSPCSQTRVVLLDGICCQCIDLLSTSQTTSADEALHNHVLQDSRGGSRVSLRDRMHQGPAGRRKAPGPGVPRGRAVLVPLPTQPGLIAGLRLTATRIGQDYLYARRPSHVTPASDARGSRG